LSADKEFLIEQNVRVQTADSRAETIWALLVVKTWRKTEERQRDEWHHATIDRPI
jgi:hypothetical protein